MLILVQNGGHMAGKEVTEGRLAIALSKNLQRNISTLRAALGENSEDHRYIETVPKRGYRFIADVREFRDESAELLVAESAKAQIVIEESGVSSQGAIETVPEPVIRSGEVGPSKWSLGYILDQIKSHKRSAVLALATIVIAGSAFAYYFYFAKVAGDELNCSHAVRQCEC